MQDQIEILKFEETPESKHIGVAHVRLFKQVVLRYKLIENKDASGYFVAPPSYKREYDDGKEKWVQWFMLDSQVFSEEVQDMIRMYVDKQMKQKSASKGSGSVFDSQADQTSQVQLNANQAHQETQNQYAQASRGDENIPF